MTKHQKIDGLPSLDRRSFLVGTAATGLVFGYVALPHVKDALGATSSAAFEPTVWYAIGHDGKVTVTVGKADMGQHIASTMAQLVAEELHRQVPRADHPGDGARPVDQHGRDERPRLAPGLFARGRGRRRVP